MFIEEESVDCCIEFSAQLRRRNIAIGLLVEFVTSTVSFVAR